MRGVKAGFLVEVKGASGQDEASQVPQAHSVRGHSLSGGDRSDPRNPACHSPCSQLCQAPTWSLQEDLSGIATEVCS